MTYVMLDSKSGKYAISEKNKSFAGGAMLDINDVEQFYGKYKIVKTNEEVIERYRNETGENKVTNCKVVFSGDKTTYKML